ncbi:MAG: tetratricopeptide repeat protein, partial [FCB group bacterium]|nr:tetratricopeptide repeat protein [FCB group bacterium]
AEILYLISIQNYLNLFPKGAQADLYMLSAGGLYYNHEKYQASRHYLNLLISEFPASSRIEKSKQFILQGYYQEKDFRSAENYARQLSQENISSDLRQFAQAKISESIYSYAEVLEKNQNHISAGSEFKRAALTMTKPENISNTLWKSARQFHEAAAWDSAVVSYELIVQKTPNSNWADKALYNKAFIYQDSLKDRSNAAATFERLADSYPNSEYAKIALNNARVNFIELGNYDSALKVSEKYLRLYPNTPDAVAILYEDAELYLRMNRLDKAVAAYSSFTQRFPDDPRNVQAHYQVGKYHLDKGDKVSAENSIRKTVEAHRGLLEKGQTGFPKYASFALDYLLKQKMDRFLALEYKPFSAIQQKRIAKQNLKRELDQGYNELISYGQKEAIEAFYNICRLDEDIAKAELDRDVPQADIEQRMLNREEILARALELYLTAAASFNSAKYTIAGWERNLRGSYDENIQKLNNLNQYADSTGILPPDSLIKKQMLQDGLKEIEESVALAVDVQRRCNEKIAEIYLDDARYVHQNLNTLLDIPDRGQKRPAKMYSRILLLSQGFMPRAMTVFDLYLQAHSVVDTIEVSPIWKDSIIASANELTDTIFVQYNEVIGRALKRYESNLTSFRQRLNDGDFSAIDIMDWPQRYLGFGNEFIDSMFINIDGVMRWAHGSQKISPITHHLDSLYTASAKYYIDYYYGIPEKNKEYYADFNRKFDETADDLFLDGLDLLEMINDDVDLYLYNLLEYAVERIEAYAVVNDDGDWILREIVKHSPGEYGYLVGLAAAGEKIISGIEWKVSPSADEDYKYAEYDDSGWMNAALVIRKHPPPPVTPVPSVSTDTSAVTIDSTAAVSDSAIIITDTTIQISSAEDSLEIPMGEEIAVAPAAPEFDYSALDEMGAPAIWLAQPAEKAYFRYLFNIPGKPISGRVSLSADENYVIFINGEFVGEDGEDESDWETPDNYSALSFLRNGQNIIAVKASDPDLTAHGFWLKLEYSVMPESIDNLPIVREPRGD